MEFVISGWGKDEYECLGHNSNKWDVPLIYDNKYDKKTCVQADVIMLLKK